MEMMSLHMHAILDLLGTYLATLHIFNSQAAGVAVLFIKDLAHHHYDSYLYE